MTPKKPGIYTITNLIDGKMYIGRSVNLSIREKEHFADLKDNTHYSDRLQRAVNKYGIENFKFEVLIECDIEQLCSEEHYWCNLLDTHNRDRGYNIAPTHPHKKVCWDEESIKKRENTRKENAETRGYYCTTETLKKKSEVAKRQSRAHLSINSLTEWRKNNPPAHTGYKHSDEAKEKMRLRKLGKKASQTAKENMRSAVRVKHEKAIIQLTLDGEFIAEYKSIQDASIAVNRNFANISQVCNRKRNKCADSKWVFKTEYINKN